MRSLKRSPWRSLGARQEGTAQNAGDSDSSRHTGWAQRAVLQSGRGQIPGPHDRDGRGHRAETQWCLELQELDDQSPGWKRVKARERLRKHTRSLRGPGPLLPRNLGRVPWFPSRVCFHIPWCCRVCPHAQSGSPNKGTSPRQSLEVTQACRQRKVRKSSSQCF